MRSVSARIDDPLGKKAPKEKKQVKAATQSELPVPATEVDDKKTKSVSALKKFNTMFKSRINAKRSILGPVATAEPAPQEVEKKPAKPKAKTGKTKRKEDEDIDYNDAKSDDEEILSGEEKSDGSKDKDDSSNSESSSEEQPKEERKAPAKPGKKQESGKKGSNVSVDESRDEPASDLDEDDDSSIASIFKDSDESEPDLPKPG